MTTTHVPTDVTSIALTPRQERMVELRDGMHPGSRPSAIVPRTFAETEVMCRALAGAGLIPAAYKDRPTDMIIVVMSGAELGIPPMQALRLYHIIEGVPRLGAEGIRAIILQSPDCEYFEFAESSDTRAVWIGKRRGRPEKSITWTIERARKAQLLEKKNWQKSPEDMLNARASMQLGRLNWPHIAAGLYSSEEAMDGVLDAEWNETPKHAFVAPPPVASVAASSGVETREFVIPATTTVTVSAPTQPATGERRQRGRSSAEKPPEQPATPPPVPSPPSATPVESTGSQAQVLDKWGQAVGRVEAKKTESGLMLNDALAARDANPTTADLVATTSLIESASSTASATESSSSVVSDFDDDPAEPVQPPDSMQKKYENWLKGCRSQKECVDGIGGFKTWLGGLGDTKIDALKRPEVVANRKLYTERKAQLP